MYGERIRGRRIYGSRVTGTRIGVARDYDIRSLFWNGEQGTFNDIHTYSTSYFTDAGTTPATIGDAIYQINGQSGNGVNWTQATATARPVLSARYNLISSTEVASLWTDSAGSAVITNVADPLGGTGAVRVITDSVDTRVRPPLNGAAGNLFAGRPYKHRFMYRSSNGSRFRWFDWCAREYTELTGTSEWQVFEVTSMCEVDADANPIFRFDITGALAGTDIEIFALDTRLASDTDQPAYQRVGDLGADPGDYDTVGFKKYLKFDRGDDVVAGTLAADNYSVAVGTRAGIYFGTSTHAGGSFEVGPTTYTGGPAGLFDDLASGSDCRLIGPPITVNRAFTAAEKAAIIQWFQNRGAGPEYTP